MNKAIWGWALYDWANSAYAVSVLAVVFQFYFVDVLAISGGPGEGGIQQVSVFGVMLPGATLWAWTVSLSILVVVVISPLVGAIADFAGRKKLCLFLFCTLGAITTMLMVLLSAGMWQLGMLLFVLSNIGFVGGNVVRNNFV